MSTIAGITVKIAADIADFQNKIADMQNSFHGLAKAAESTSRVQNSFQGMAMAAAGASKALLGSLAGVAAGLGAVGLKSVNMAAEMEQSRIAFTTMLGSAQKAKSFLAELSSFAAKTPFEFKGLEESSKLLLAFGFNAKEIIPTMTAVGNAIAGLGGGTAEIDRVVRALGQLKSKGRVSAEEMMQLAEIGIPAWEMLAQKIGVDIPTAMKMAEKGAIPATTAIQGIIEGMNKKFPNMMEQQSQTILGKLSTIKDSGAAIMRTLGDKIVDALDVKDRLSSVTDWLTEFSQSIEKSGIKETIDKFFSEDMKAKIVIVAGAITGALVPAFASLAVSATTALVPLLPFIAAGALIAAVAYGIYKAWGPAKEFFKELWDKIKSAFDTAINTISNTVSGWVNGIAKWWDDIKNKTGEAWDAVKNISSTVWNEIKNTLNSIWEGIKSAIGGVWDNIKTKTSTIWGEIKTSLSTLWNNIKNDVGNVWSGIYEKISGYWTDIKTGFKNIVDDALDWGKNLLGNFIKGIKSKIRDLVDIVQEAANTVSDFLGFQSPTRLGPGRYADEWAPNLVKMFAEGIRTEIPTLQINLTDFAAKLSPLPAMAMGGIVTSPGLSLVGERGPEILNLPGGAEVIPLDRGGDYYDINVNITGNYISSDYDVDRIGEQLVRILQRKGVRM